MASKAYTDTDYGVCRFIVENPVGGSGWDATYATISNIGASLTVTRVQRAKLLNLIDGTVEETADGDKVKLTGLGQKTAAEAVRLGIASV